MIDHLTVPVSDYAAAKAFYLTALEPLGYGFIMEFGAAGGFGVDGKPDLWLQEKKAVEPTLHLAFRSRTRAGVDAFHAAALSAGGKDNGAPGLRPDYHPNYYGAFVFDPDGNNIEAVCHAEE